MKRLSLWVICSLILVVLISLLTLRYLSKTKNPTNIVFIGPEKYGATFEESLKGGRAFDDLYSRARESEKAGDHETAIKLLSESLPYVGIGLEKGMVYKKLAEIYRAQGNLEKELFYVEEWPKYSMNQQINEEAKLRAAEIRQVLHANTSDPEAGNAAPITSKRTLSS